jgi:hypothetical protein
MCKGGHQIRIFVNIWAEIIGNIVLGPYLSPNRLSTGRYCDFLEIILPGVLIDVPPAVRHMLWFQNNGAPAQYWKDVRQWFNATYRVRWTGLREPASWPPRRRI